MQTPLKRGMHGVAFNPLWKKACTTVYTGLKVLFAKPSEKYFGWGGVQPTRGYVQTLWKGLAWDTCKMVWNSLQKYSLLWIIWSFLISTVKPCFHTSYQCVRVGVGDQVKSTSLLGIIWNVLIITIKSCFHYNLYGMRWVWGQLKYFFCQE